MNLPIDPGSIASRFCAAAQTYDELSEVQRTVAERLMERLEDKEGMDRILEIGCGTGTLTELLLRHFPHAEIHAVDIAEAMVEQARKRPMDGSRVRWHVADAREFRSNEQFPLIISSSALHWMTPVFRTIKRLHGLLKAGGQLASALMVAGTFEELHAARLFAAPAKPARINLPQVEELLDSIEESGLTLLESREETLQAKYDSAADFLRSIHQQGVTGTENSLGGLLNRTELHKLMNYYDRRFSTTSGGVFATYRVLYVRAVKGEI
ncbi:MAG: methyltransferase domain-containing protein [Syntrophobacteraceae bacterium]